MEVGGCLGPVGLTFRGLEGGALAQPTSDSIVIGLHSALPLGFLPFSPALSDCCFLPWFLFLHLPLKCVFCIPFI